MSGAIFCRACGIQNTIEARFCSGCGAGMGSEGDTVPPDTVEENRMSLMTAWGIYAASVVLLALSVEYMVGLAFFLYIGIGIYMTRGVMRQLIEWHPVHATLYNVTSAKLGMVALWPLKMFFLLIRLSVNRVL